MGWLINRRVFSQWLTALLVISAWSSCVESQSAPPPPLKVIATTGMIADIVRQVGGDRVAVTQLMGEGVDPHLYKPTRTDIAAMLGADITFYNGLLLEGKMTDTFVRVATSGRAVYAVTELIEEKSLLELSESESKHFDPHVWMDPSAWARAVEVVRDKLSAHDKAFASKFQLNAENLLDEISRLDTYARKTLETIPENQRVLVTAHDAFNYLGRRYKIAVFGIQGISTESEASLKALEDCVKLLVERKIPAVFVESTVPDRNVKALIAGAKAKGHDVKIGGELFSDAMGKPGTYEGTYIGMIDHNITTIARALGATAPEKGLNGKLGT